MMRSLYSAVSGLKTHQTKMDVIGNNISNVNTESFKASRVTFTDIMYQTTSNATSGNGATGVGGTNAKQIGLGVTTGATYVSITEAGAAETTGNPFDLRLTDSQSTNFFIVSDGTNTMFTRSGSFYVDGNGYLCMSSTGYTVMGWQVDPTTGEIKKDVVSSLQVMSPANQTSSPEATEKGYVSGILDKNDSNVTSEDGYVMTLQFYDDLGYSYTARFIAKDTEVKGKYTVELAGITDSEGVDILAASGMTAEEIFGTEIFQTDANGNVVDADGNVLTQQEDGTWTYTTTEMIPSTPLTETTYETNDAGEFVDANGNVLTQVGDVWCYQETTTTTQNTYVDAAEVTAYTEVAGNRVALTDDGNGGYFYNDGTNNIPVDAGDVIYIHTAADGTETEVSLDATGYYYEEEVQTTTDVPSARVEIIKNVTDADGNVVDVDGNILIEQEDGTWAYEGDEIQVESEPSTMIGSELIFDTNDGTFISIGGEDEVTLQMSKVLSNTVSEDGRTSNFQDIVVDFTSCLNYENGGTSTMKALKGDTDGDGTGKALGALTGIAVDADGKIYGTYDNGNTVLLCQIAVTQFSNASGLEKAGENCYQTTLNSGEFNGIGVEINADGSSMSTGELEMSNVDLSAQFTDMIITQRGFQANSRVITTSDTLLEELINLKR